ncbi:MAG: antibiotic biosynthesis monooxygenase [Oribacterium sp.]|nr:antibiotic biosynthesis monooxygenase [Oribacterium sp.]
MIIYLVRYKCKAGSRKKFLEALCTNSIGELSQQEEGNIQYEYSYGLDNDELLLTEVWEDESSIENHRNSAHFLKLGEIKSEFVENTEILRYKADKM